MNKIIFFEMFTSSQNFSLFLLVSLLIISSSQSLAQDPWDEDKGPNFFVDDDKNIPPDLKIKPVEKPEQTDESYGIGEWFYRRILSIVLKGGQVKENEDGSVDISLQMKLGRKEWSILDEYLTSTTSLSEEKFRRSLGYIEQSIYEPSLPTKIILAWSDHIQIFLAEYKTEITWTLTLLAVLILLFWLWTYMSHKSAVVIVIIALYAYEVFVSYKEAEQKEIEKFLTAVNSCKWYVWSSQCELPKPDPLIFLKHMNPLKIGLRMFTTIISEPIIVLSDTVKTLTHGITDGLWYPLDIIMYGVFVVIFNLILLIFLITIVFNYILNVPIDLSFGIFSVIFRQRKRNLFSDNSNENQENTRTRVDNINDNAITGATLDKLLDVVTRALNAPHGRNNLDQNADIQVRTNLKQHAAIQDINDESRRQMSTTSTNGLKRSASTGRLPNLKSFQDHDQCKDKTKRKNNKYQLNGSGDAR